MKLFLSQNYFLFQTTDQMHSLPLFLFYQVTSSFHSEKTFISHDVQQSESESYESKFQEIAMLQYTFAES